MEPVNPVEAAAAAMRLGRTSLKREPWTLVKIAPAMAPPIKRNVLTRPTATPLMGELVIAITFLDS